MKTVLLLSSIVLLQIFVQSTSAQNSTNPNNSLYFYFINGYAVSYKFGGNESMHYRIGLDFASAYSSGTSDGTSKSTYSGTITDNVNNRSIDDFNFNINLTPRIYIPMFENELISINLGAGAFLGYSYTKTKTQIDYKYISSSPYTQFVNSSGKNNVYSVGLCGVLNFEGRVSDNITLFSEVLLSVGRSITNSYSNTVLETVYSGYTQKSNSESRDNSKSWFYNLSNIRIGVGYHF